MKKERWIAAMIATATVIATVPSLSANAWTKDSVYAVTEDEIVFTLPETSEFTWAVLGNTDEDTKYIWTGDSGLCAVVMEDASAAINMEELSAINPTLTAIPVSEFEYYGRSSADYGGANLNVSTLDENCTYIIKTEEKYDSSQLYTLTGVTEVYELTAATYTNAWFYMYDSENAIYDLYVGVNEGEVLTMDDCAGLPYTVDSMKENGENAYILYVNCEESSMRYKSAREMILALFEIGKVKGASPMLVHEMTSSSVIDDYLLKIVKRVSYDGDVNADGTTDITDAVLILQHYAESAASGALAASETNMDVNRDGSVDLDDATEVLQIYAENAAGVEAS